MRTVIHRPRDLFEAEESADGSIASSEEPDAAAASGDADRGFHGDGGRGGGL